MITFPTFRGILHKSTAAFSPASLNPVVWVDANDATTLFNAATGGSTPADGGYVRRWMDKSSSNFSYAQTGADSACPIRRATAGPGGRGVLEYSTTSRTLINTLPTGSGGSILRSTTGNPVTGGTVILAIKHNATVTGAINVYFSVETPASPPTRLIVSSNRATNGKWDVGGRRLDGDSFVYQQSASSLDTNWTVMCGIFNYTDGTITLYHNTASASDSSAVKFSTGIASTTENPRQTLGAFNNAAYFGEMFVVNRVLTSTELTNAFAYMNAKWRP